MTYVVGIDIGGTCTDCVVVDDAGTVTLAKAFSTPPDFQHGIVDALGVAAGELGLAVGDLRRARRASSSTRRRWPRTRSSTAPSPAPGVITTGGFEDTLFAMRGGYGRWSGLTEDEKRNPIETDKLPPLVDRSARSSASRERTDADGQRARARPTRRTSSRPCGASLDAGRRRDRRLACSGRSPTPPPSSSSRAWRGAWRRTCFLTLSHEIAPVVGEYERTSTVALNARLGPVVARLPRRPPRVSSQGLGFAGTLLVAQAHGGLLPVEEAASTGPSG